MSEHDAVLVLATAPTVGALHGNSASNLTVSAAEDTASWMATGKILCPHFSLELDM